MEKIIRRLIVRLKIEYGAVWALAGITFLLGELGVIPNGVIPCGTSTEYYLNIVNVALLVVCVPLSLKLFALNTLRSLRRMNHDESLVSYHRWSIIRLAMLTLCIEYGITTYYLLLHPTGLLCAAIALVTMIFCIPSSDKVSSCLEAGKNEPMEDLAEPQ